MARALIVGCGCRGRELAGRLVGGGWRVRGTTRVPDHLPPIERSGAEGVLADPERAASILDHVGDVSVIFWLMGSALGEPEVIAAIHGPRLERILEKLADSPVRGIVYEAGGGVQPHHLERGAAAVREAVRRWRIPAEIVSEDPADSPAWTAAMLAAADRLTGQSGCS